MCRREQKDRMLISCETCKVPFVDETELVTQFTRDELKVIADILLKDWRVYVFTAVCVAVGVGLLYWQAREQINTQVEKYRIAVSNQVVTAYSAATNQLASEFRDFATNASNQIAVAHASITDQIAEEFQTTRIKQTVQTVAKGEARDILESEVRPTADAFREEASFIRTVAHAQAYDFKAYQRLQEIGNQTNENAELAKEVISEIDRSLGRDRSQFSPRRLYVQVMGTNTYRGPFTSDELIYESSRIEQNKTAYNREGFVNAVADAKQQFFLPFLIEFLTN